MAMTPVFQTQCLTPYSFQPAFFPGNAHLFYTLGMISSEDGVCLGQDLDIHTVEKCNSVCQGIDNDFSSNSGVVDCRNTPYCTNEQGWKFQEKDGETYSYATNPRKKENYQKALAFANENLLIPNYFEKDTKTIIHDFKKIHAILLDQVAPYEELGDIGGTYRTRESLILADEIIGNFWEHGKNKIVENGGSVKHLRALDTLKMKNDRYGDLDEALLEASELEKEAIRLTGLLFLEPDKIEVQMEAFIDELREKIFDSNLPPADVAAFAHTEPIRIHPFADGCGKFARIIKDVAGFHKGLPYPTYFFSKGGYNEKAKEAITNPEVFVDYMEASMEKTENLSKTKQICLLESYEVV